MELNSLLYHSLGINADEDGVQSSIRAVESRRWCYLRNVRSGQQTTFKVHKEHQHQRGQERTRPERPCRTARSCMRSFAQGGWTEGSDGTFGVGGRVLQACQDYAKQDLGAQSMTGQRYKELNVQGFSFIQKMQEWSALRSRAT